MRMQSTGPSRFCPFFMFSFRPASCLHFPTSCDDSPHHRLSLLAVRDWQQHSSFFVLLWMKLHSLCQLHCHSMKSLDPEGPLFLSISRGTAIASRRSGKKLWLVCRLGFFAPINIGPWLYPVIERIFRPFFLDKSTHTYGEYRHVHRNSRDECTIIYYRSILWSKLYENWRRVISPRAWNFISGGKTNLANYRKSGIQFSMTGRMIDVLPVGTCVFVDRVNLRKLRKLRPQDPPRGWCTLCFSETKW